jgi:hypothetical protein
MDIGCKYGKYSYNYNLRIIIIIIIIIIKEISLKQFKKATVIFDNALNDDIGNDNNINNNNNNNHHHNHINN